MRRGPVKSADGTAAAGEADSQAEMGVVEGGTVAQEVTGTAASSSSAAGPASSFAGSGVQANAGLSGGASWGPPRDDGSDGMSLLPASPEESPGRITIGIYILDPAERGSIGSGSAASTPQPTDPATAALLDFGSKVLDKLKSWFTPRAPIVVDTSAYLDTRYSSIGPAGFSPRQFDGAERERMPREAAGAAMQGVGNALSIIRKRPANRVLD